MSLLLSSFHFSSFASSNVFQIDIQRKTFPLQAPPHLLSTLNTTIVSETSFKISSPTPFSSTAVLSCKLIVSALLKTLTTELGIFCVTFFFFSKINPFYLVLEYLHFQRFFYLTFLIYTVSFHSSFSFSSSFCLVYTKTSLPSLIKRK